VFFPDQVRYTCLVGFSTTGKHYDPKFFDVNCTGTGHFIGYQTCQPIECGKAPQDVNSFTSASKTYTYLQKASYECFKGYTLNEDVYGDTVYQRQCEATGNFSEGKECLGVRCGIIPTYSDAKLTSPLPPDEKFFRFPMTLVYECDVGFTLDGTPAKLDTSNTVFRTSCDAEGEMSRTSSPCQRVSCGFPTPALRMTWFPNKAGVFEDVVKYTCEEGYTMNQEPDGQAEFSITCLATGAYEAFPGSCLPVKCGVMPPGPHDKIVKDCTETKICTYDMDTEFECDPGYSVDAEDDPTSRQFAGFSVRCLKTGNFTDIPPCLNIDNCKGKTCGGHGTCVDHDMPTGDAMLDWHCACDLGYENSTVGDDKVCTNINDCPSSKSFAYECSGAGQCQDLLMAYSCACDDGYQVISLKDSENATCIPTGCGQVPEVKFATHENVSWPRATELFDNTNLSLPKDMMFYTQPAVTYTCDTGFTLTGYASGGTTFQVKCLLNGTEVRMISLPTCDPISCGAPPSIPFADPATHLEVMRYDKDLAKRTLGYTCQSGYTTDVKFHRFIPNASFEVTCNADGNLTGAQTCVPVKCGKPPKVANAVANAPDERVTYPEIVVYTCDEGYSTDGTTNEMKKKFTISCQENSQLTQTKVCQKIICGGLANADNGTIASAGGKMSSMKFNQTATFKASTGYSLNGKVDGPKAYTVTCLSNGSFVREILTTPPPSFRGAPIESCNAQNLNACQKNLAFKPVDCGLPPVVNHASHIHEAKVFEQKVQYTCSSGYSTDGLPTTSQTAGFEIQCQANGKFTATLSCKPVLCVSMPSPTNATLSPADQANLTYTQSAKFQCKPGYKLQNGETVFLVPCQTDGTFAASPDCSNINDCEAPDVLCSEEGHGYCVDNDPPPKGNHIDDYHCVCDPGFKPSIKNESGVQKRYCENIDDCPADACNPGGCGDLILDYTCFCPIGFWFYNGTSDGKPHACKPQECGDPPTVAHATANTSGMQVYKDVVQYTCATGYTLSGEVDGESTFTLRCKARAGKGSKGSFPTLNSTHHECKPVLCGIPESLPHSSKSRDDSMTFEQTVTYTCLTGYSTDRQCHPTDSVFEKVCSSDSEIKFSSGQEASCMSVLAGTPNVRYASYKDTPMYFPEERTVLCDEGYSLDGRNAEAKTFKIKATANCSIEKTPTGASCKIMICGKAQPKANSNHDAGEKELEYQEVVIYTGITGYTLNGRHNGPKFYKMECQANGSLMSITQAGELPFEPVQCGAPPFVAQASYSTATRHYKQFVDYECNAGYSTDTKPAADGGVTNFTIVCQSNGNFTPVQECKRIVCGTGPSVPLAKKMSSGDVEYEGKAEYKCSPGYSLDGKLNGVTKFNLTCLQTGDFADPPQCQDMVDCKGSMCGASSGGTCVETSPPTGDHWDDHYCECKSGFKAQNMTKNGKWYKTCGNIADCPPKACQPGFCTDLVNDYKCHCPDGYHEGPNVAENLKHDCLPDSCGKAPEFNHGSSSSTGNLVFGDTVTYKCDHGYTVDGSPNGAQEFTIECVLSNLPGKTVNFTDGAGCKPVQCPSPPDLSHSDRTTKDPLTFGQTVTYTCHKGYSHLKQTKSTCPGESKYTLVCSASSAYVNDDKSDKTKQCTALSAGVPQSGSLPHALFEDYEMFYPDSQVVQCKAGYSLNPKDPDENTFELKVGTDCAFMSHPVCVPVSCGTAPVVQHATSDKVGTDIIFPTKVTYTTGKCHTVDGTVNGSRTFSTECKADGKFHSMESILPLLPVSCLPKDRPGAIKPSGEKTCDEKVIYKCKKGYSTDGKSVSESKANGQFEETCTPSGIFTKTGQCVIVKCPNVPSPGHVMSIPNGTFVYNDTISFECKPGYSLDGTMGGDTKYSVKCQASGEFSEAPAQCINIDDCAEGGDFTCQPHGTCFDLPNPTGDHYDDYTCKCSSGFKLVRHNKSWRSKNKGIEGAPHCVNIEDCPKDACQAKYPNGEVLQGSCQDLVNDFKCICTLGSYPIDSAHDCKPQTCGEYPVVANAGTPPPKEQLYNRSYTYQCKEGYTLDGSAGADTDFTVKCEAKTGNISKGTRTGMGACKPVKCDVPSTANAKINATKFFFSETLTYTCDVGYSTNGSCDKDISHTEFEIICDKTGVPKFVDDAHTGCVANLAGIPVVSHANLSSDLMFWPESQSIACAVGYSTNSTDITARAFTVKTHPNCGFESHPNCVLIECGLVPVVQYANSSGGNKFGQTQSYKCHPGYTLDGKVNNGSRLDTFEIACQANGSFESPMGCQPVQCGKKPVVEHATCTGDTLVFKDQVSCTCDLGYTLDPNGSASGAKSFNVTCNQDAVFVGLQTCKPVQCKLPPQFKGNSKLIPPDDNARWHYVFEGTLDYRCLPGYSLSGKPPDSSADRTYTETCQADGNFTDATSCVNVDYCLTGKQHCGPGGECIDGLLNYTCNCSAGYQAVVAAGKKNGSAVRLRCKEINECKAQKGDTHCQPGTCKDGLDSYTCECDTGYHSEKLENSSKAQKCVANVCDPGAPKLANADSSSATGKPMTYPAKVTYTCKTGYSLDGQASGETEFTVGCLADKTVKRVNKSGSVIGDGALLSCIPVACPPLPVVNNSVVSTSMPMNYTSPAATYTCKPGFTTNGDTKGPTTFSVQCLETGELTDPEKCLPVSCGNYPQIAMVASVTPPTPMEMVYQDVKNYTCQTGHTLTGFANGSSSFLVSCSATGALLGPESKSVALIEEAKASLPKCDCRSPNGLQDAYRNGATPNDATLCMQTLNQAIRPCYKFTGKCNPDWTPCTTDAKAEKGLWKTLYSTGKFGVDKKSKAEFNKLFQVARSGIARRECADCFGSDHNDVYFRRKKSPSQYDAWEGLMITWMGNVGFHSDFDIYSSMEDALADKNAWKYCNGGHKTIGFPRDCGPTTLTGWQWTSFTHPYTRKNYKWSVQLEAWDPSNCPYNAGGWACWGDSAFQECPIDRQGVYDKITKFLPDHKAMYEKYLELKAAEFGCTKEAVPKLGTCNPVSCGVPPVFSNSNADTNAKVFGVPHLVHCKEGYKSQGQSSFTISCLANGSYSSHVGCQPVSCGVPQPTGNALPGTTTAVYYTQNVTYTCKDEFSVSGVEDGPTTFERACSSSGEFEGNTVCKDIDFCVGHPCGRGDCYDVTLNPEKVPNTTTFLQTMAGKPVASNGQYVCYCDDGYETTTVNGKLTCTEDDCHGNPCGIGRGICTDLSAAPNASDGAYSCSCFPGFELFVSENGTATCKPVVCEPDVPAIANTIVPIRKKPFKFARPATFKGVLFQDIIFYKCKPGYSTDGSTVNKPFAVKCSASGVLVDATTGAPSLPHCVPILCGTPQNVPFASFPPGVEVPAPMNFKSPPFTYTCDKGHQLDTGLTNFSIICTAKGELSPTATCKPRVCGYLKPVDYATLSIAPDTKMKYEDIARYDCMSGYKTSLGRCKFVVRCLETGSLSSYDSCNPVQCAPDLVYGKPKKVLCDLGKTVDGTRDGKNFYYLRCTAERKIVGETKCLPVTIDVSGKIMDATNAEVLPDALVTLGATEYYPPSSTTYKTTDGGEYCYMETDIRSETSCEAAAAQMNLGFAGSVDDPTKHKYCFIDANDKVVFNADSSKTMPDNMKSVCYTQPGMFTKFRILPSKDTGEMGSSWTVSSVEAYYTNDCSGDKVSVYAAFASSHESSAAQAFDGNHTGGWKASCSHCQPGQEYIGFETTQPTVVRCVKIHQCLDYGCAPSLAFQGQELGTSKWIHLVLSQDTKPAGNWTKFETIPAVLKQEKTASDGKYTVQVGIGKYVIVAAKNGYIANAKDVVVDASEPPQNTNFMLSPNLPPDEWRLVLSWRAKPVDLDTWLFFGPGINCDKNNYNEYLYDWNSAPIWTCWAPQAVYYHAQNLEDYDSGLSAELEYDVVDGYGPETLRIKGMGKCKGKLNCKLIYGVNNYESDEPLGISGGEVTISSGLIERGKVTIPESAGDKKWIPLLVIDAETSEYRLWKESDWNMYYQQPDSYYD